jgi:hypothetical protein
MQWSGSTLDNVGAPIWVVDPMVEQVNDTEALRDTDLQRVRSVQTLTVGLIGYGCGVGLATLFGVALLKKGMPPFFVPWQLPLVTQAAILFICWLAASLGIRKIRHLELGCIPGIMAAEAAARL